MIDVGDMLYPRELVDVTKNGNIYMLPKKQRLVRRATIMVPMIALNRSIPIAKCRFTFRLPDKQNDKADSDPPLPCEIESWKSD